MGVSGGLAVGLADTRRCEVAGGITYPGGIESSVMVVGGGSVAGASLVDGVSGGHVEGGGL